MKSSRETHNNTTSCIRRLFFVVVVVVFFTKRVDSVLLKGSRFSLSRTKESKWKKKKRGNSTLSFQNPKLLVYLGFWSKGLSFVFARQNTTRTHPTTEKTKNTTKNHRLLLLLLVVVVVARSLFFCIFFCFFCLSLSLSLSLFL